MNNVNDHDVVPPEFIGYTTKDRFRRQIKFYISIPPAGNRLPLVVFIPGSGCYPVFRVDPGGRVRRGYEHLLLQVVNGRAIVLLVEKPGANQRTEPTEPGTAVGCPPQFLKEHTLPRWAEAVAAAVRNAALFPFINRQTLLVIGHSEGGITAAHVAAVSLEVSHVALLSSSGPTQLFDLVAAEAHTAGIYSTFSKITRNPNSITRFAWGHPYRRWSSFLATSTLDELLRSKAQVYLRHGAADQIVPIEAFEVLTAELVRHGRSVRAERIEGADHSFATPEISSAEGMRKAFSAVFDWFIT